MLTTLSPDVIAQAHRRIAPHIHRTPLLHSSLLNQWLRHELYFKVEGFQRIGAFKLRGALNTVLSLHEAGELPTELVAFSSGNHAQAVAYAGRLFNLPTTIYMTHRTSAIKQQATRGYGAQVITTETRKQAEVLTREHAARGAYFIHPYDDDRVIAGQGTACLEALQDMQATLPTAIFATCGGGGWLSGSYLATQLLAPHIPVFAGEPANANDASRSYQSGTIVGFDDTPATLADGAATLCVSPRTFQYLQKLRGFYEVSEEQMVYWTQWLTHLLKTTVEPTSAVAMGAAAQWLRTQTTPQRVLVLLSGGNIAPETHHRIWETNHLQGGGE